MSNRGFTLIETLVAVLLLTAAIAGPLSIAARGLLGASVARDQVTAFYLAQDAMEYIHYVRDSNTLSDNPWLSGLDSCLGANGCAVDSIQNTAVICDSPCQVLGYNTTYRYFSYSSPMTPQQYRRVISITTPVGTNDCTTGHGCEAAVTVTVSWSDRGSITRSITVKENLFDWQ